jgi:hypothetical protein
MNLFPAFMAGFYPAMLPKCSLVNLIPEFLFQRTKAAGAEFSFVCRRYILP